MKTYDNYRKGLAVVRVKKGFSWPGFFFLFMWAFYKKLWKFGILIILIIAFLILMELGIENISSTGSEWVFTIAHLVLSIFVGYVGNDVYILFLVRQGYIKKGELESSLE